MTTSTAAHMAGEELMALVDGELTGTALRAAEEHVASCELCASELAALQQDAHTLQAWNVAGIPAQVESAVLARLKDWSAQPPTPKRSVSSRQPNLWLWGVASALTATALIAALIATSAGRSSRSTQSLAENRPPTAPAPAGRAEEAATKSATTVVADRDTDKDIVDGTFGGTAAPSGALAPTVAAPKMAPSPVSPAKPTVPARARRMIANTPEINAPMIAKTVALTLTVKDVERSRQGLEELLRTYGGYAAQMEVSTPEGGTRTLHASLRVPSGQMRGMLAELKGYGKVTNETQSGEEVGQQHADLVARLNTSRESEERLRGILKTRAGDLSEVLEVEQEIARVRGEIESMEAEQQGLEHSVTYATIELQMNEEGQGPAGQTVGSRLAAGARQGWDNATEAVIGFLLFLLQYALATVLIAALIGVPSWLAWRRWKRVRTGW